MGTVEVVEDDLALLNALTEKGYNNGRVEPAIRLHIATWNLNCQQHITPRFTKEEFEPIVKSLNTRFRALEVENHALSNGLGRVRPNRELVRDPVII